MNSASELRCRICNAKGPHQQYRIREMMFGTREEFTYFMCRECGCLQIGDFPSDMARHYPKNYYSLSTNYRIPKGHGIMTPLVHWRTEAALFGKKPRLSRLVRPLVPLPEEIHEYGPMLKNAGISNFDARIVDVGCGARPFRLAAFKQLGFRRLLGIDPFIPGDTTFFGIPVLKRSIDALEEPCNLIMFHHSLEHIPDQLKTLKQASTLLVKGGFCLIRIPLVDSALWERYGTDWVELDAPRHFYLHSHDSIKRVAHAAGLTFKKVVFDSEAWEFLGSEQYRRNIAMRDPQSHFVDPDHSGFTKNEILEFKKEAEQINSAGRGGRAAFYFEKE